MLNVRPNLVVGVRQMIRWLASFLMVSSVAGADWTQFRGPRRDGVIPAEERPLRTLPAEPKVIWRRPAGDGFAAPVVANGRVFCLGFKEGRETVYALEAGSGKPVWESDLDAPHKDGFGTGPRCTPVVDGSLVYAQSCRGELAAMDVASGAPKWRVNYLRDFGAIYIGEKGNAAGATRHGNNGSPVIDGPDIIAAAGGTNGASIVCLDKLSGKVRWKSGDDGASYSPPVVAELAGARQVVAFTIQGVVGLDRANGKPLWRVPLWTTFGRHVIAPVIHGDLVIVASHVVGTVATRIVREAGVIKAVPAWHNKEALINFASPLSYRETLFGLGPKSDLAAYDLSNGALRWSKTGELTTSADKSFGAFLLQEDRVLALTDGGTLLMYRASPEKYEEIARAQVCGSNWCHPAYSEGRLYVRDRKELLCVSLVE